MKNWHDGLDAQLVVWGFECVSELSDTIAIWMDVKNRVAVTYDYTGCVGVIVRRSGGCVGLDLWGGEVSASKVSGVITCEHREVAHGFMSTLGAFMGVDRRDVKRSLESLVASVSFARAAA